MRGIQARRSRLGPVATSAARRSLFVAIGLAFGLLTVALGLAALALDATAASGDVAIGGGVARVVAATTFLLVFVLAGVGGPHLGRRPRRPLRRPLRPLRRPRGRPRLALLGGQLLLLEIRHVREVLPLPLVVVALVVVALLGATVALLGVARLVAEPAEAALLVREARRVKRSSSSLRASRSLTSRLMIV